MALKSFAGNSPNSRSKVSKVEGHRATGTRKELLQSYLDRDAVVQS